MWVPPLPSTAVLNLIDTELARRGRVRVDEPEIIRRWSISAVFRVPTDRGGPVWFKAVPPAFAHEGRIAGWVAQTRPEHGARVVAHGDGWLLTENLGEVLKQESVQPHGHPLEAAARIQIASIGRTNELSALGCPQRGPTQLCAELDSLSRRLDLLEPHVAQSLETALPRLFQTLEPLEEDGLPNVLVHGDIQEGNAHWTGRSWVIIDWTDAVVTHPFAELARPLMNATGEERRLAEASFIRVWADVVPPSMVERGLRAAAVLGAAHQVANYRHIVDRIGGADGLQELLVEWLRRLLMASTNSAYEGVGRAM
ncbi:phosphotransferase [Streptomyces sp. NPDC058525]|uniref:phosphotransferase n=1 Tax=Streptomyces sp. NPDC058525 TaxID=3346538 RepID=UPI0036564C90